MKYLMILSFSCLLLLPSLDSFAEEQSISNCSVGDIATAPQNDDGFVGFECSGDEMVLSTTESNFNVAINCSGGTTYHILVSTDGSQWPLHYAQFLLAKIHNQAIAILGDTVPGCNLSALKAKRVWVHQGV